MLKVKDISLTTERYGDGYECVVNFQVGDQTYNTVKAKLTPEATRSVVELAVAEATKMLVVDSCELKIAGEPVVLPKVDEFDAPEFAEVEEAPFRPIAVDPLAEEQF